jgi:CubicO group peptidase (beta-lactamase class C family)
LAAAPFCVTAQIQSTPDWSTLTTTLESERQRLTLPALSVAVVRGREVVYKHAFGYSDLANKVPASVDTPYPIASITKVFASIMLMQLAERGVVRLDDPVTKYLPEYKVKSSFPGTQPTTLRQLASHNSGLPRDAALNFWMNYTLGKFVFSQGEANLRWYVSKDDLLRSLSTVQLEYAPNSQHVYSYLGVSLLGIALERASGTSYQQYITDHIFKPLGMTHSGFIDDANQGQFPVGYVYVPGHAEPVIAPKWQLGAAQYSAGIYSTVDDMAKFLALQWQEDAIGGTQILSADSLRAMRVGTEDKQCGIGWWGNEAAGHHIVLHNGGHLGYLATVAAMPDMKLGVVLMTNRDNPIWDLQTHGLAIKMFELLVPQYTPQKDKSKFDPSKVDLARYAGTYAADGGYVKMKITFQDGKLYRLVEESGDSVAQIFPVGTDQFGDAPNGPASLSFKAAESGNITAAELALFTLRRVD